MLCLAITSTMTLVYHTCSKACVASSIIAALIETTGYRRGTNGLENKKRNLYNLKIKILYEHPTLSECRKHNRLDPFSQYNWGFFHFVRTDRSWTVHDKILLNTVVTLMVVQSTPFSQSPSN